MAWGGGGEDLAGVLDPPGDRFRSDVEQDSDGDLFRAHPLVRHRGQRSVAEGQCGWVSGGGAADGAGLVSAALVELAVALVGVRRGQLTDQGVELLVVHSGPGRVMRPGQLGLTSSNGAGAGTGVGGSGCRV